MNAISLRHPLPSVRNGAVLSRGGDQRWSERPFVREMGCGLIGATDLLMYLHRYRAGCRTALFQDVPEGVAPVPLAVYNRCAEALRKKYVPIIPRFGVDGLRLALGLDGYFLRYGIPLGAGWSVLREGQWRRMESMLADDIPVILSIGPDFPCFWRRSELPLYACDTDGDRRAACRTRSHFVTVTAMDAAWLRVSSWGHEYDISRAEYIRHAAEHTGSLVSNIVYVRPLRGREKR